MELGRTADSPSVTRDRFICTAIVSAVARGQKSGQS
jgi:hypothetical protein